MPLIHDISPWFWVDRDEVVADVGKSFNIQFKLSRSSRMKTSTARVVQLYSTESVVQIRLSNYYVALRARPSLKRWELTRKARMRGAGDLNSVLFISILGLCCSNVWRKHWCSHWEVGTGSHGFTANSWRFDTTRPQAPIGAPMDDVVWQSAFQKRRRDTVWADFAPHTHVQHGRGLLVVSLVNWSVADQYLYDVKHKLEVCIYCRHISLCLSCMCLTWSMMLTYSLMHENCSLHNNIRAPGCLLPNASFYLFKDSIEPKWEDVSNAKGGCWAANISVTRGPGSKQDINMWWINTVGTQSWLQNDYAFQARWQMIY